MIHDDFLALADHLAHLESGKPKQSSLRRAVSTAYYAVFYAIATLCAEQLVGSSKPWKHFSPIYRALDHGKAKKVLQKAAHDPSPYGAEVRVIGNAFVQLQERRHIADYDPEPFLLGRNETLDLIALARQAVQATRSLSSDQALLLAVHLIGRER